MSNSNKTALLVMDMQAAMVGMVPNAANFILEVKKAIDHARSSAIPVIYVVVGFREGFPEVSMNNKSFSAVKQRFGSADMNDFIKVHADLAPIAGEVVTVKRRVSAFAGSDLEVLLRAYGIQHIVLTGISTSGVVLSTTREAADKDYQITILADGCADPDEEVHQLLTTKVFPRQADVMTIAEWCA
jgi:nicotinamidase-related amidase